MSQTSTNAIRNALLSRHGFIWRSPQRNEPGDDGSRGERCVSRIFLGDPGFCAFLWDFPANGARREAGRERRTERRHWFRGNMPPAPLHSRATAAPQRAIYIKTQPAQAWLASTQSGTLFFLGMGSFGVRREARRERWTVRGGVHFTVTPFCTCAQQFAVKKRGEEGRKRPCFVLRVSCFVKTMGGSLVRSGKKFLTAGEALSRRDTWRGLWSRRPRHELYMVQ